MMKYGLLGAAAILPWLIFIIIPGLFALRWFWTRRKTNRPKQNSRPEKSA
jgi:hypothetical protein